MFSNLKNINKQVVIKYILFLGFTWLISSPISAQIDELANFHKPPEKLVVGVKITPPFIMKTMDGTYTGLSFDLWNEIAEEMGIRYTVKEYDLKGLEKALVNKEIDICINPLTVTESRLEKFEFTQPFFISSLGVATSAKRKNKSYIILSNFLSWDFLKMIGILVGSIMLFGFLVWLAERGNNPDHFEHGWQGLWDGFWWSAVTMTTVGYGDKSPKTFIGRIISLVWMFSAIVIISGFTASITSTITLESLDAHISHTEDLFSKKLGAVANSSTIDYLKRHHMKFQVYPNEVKGLEAVKNHEIDVFVHDEPIMRYQIKRHEWSTQIQIILHSLRVEYYSFSLPYDSDLLHEINPVLVKKLHSDYWQIILKKYDL